MLVDLARGLVLGTSRYTLLAVLLLGLLLWRGSPLEGVPRLQSGRALVVLGLLAEVVGMASASWSIARVGLPVAVLGVALINGHPRAAVAVLAFGLVPIPGFVHGIASPDVESLLGSGAASVIGALGWTLEVGGPLLQYGGRRFELLATDTGLVTALACAEVGWYSAVRAGGAVRQAGLRAAGGAALGLLLQPVLLLFCVATLPLGWPQVGRFLLTDGPWLALAAAVLWYDFNFRHTRRQRSGPGACEVR
ncbi:MAG: hypothetical protein JRH17_23440 [Deltaproteobacteria bacterium]|nr:hypothetical protein [Deltaproteobacteria bacterium]